MPLFALGAVVNGVVLPGFVLGIAAAGALNAQAAERWETEHGVRILQPVGLPPWKARKPYAYVEPRNPSPSSA